MHPGLILFEKYMKPLKLNADQLAQRMGVHRSTLSSLIAGKQRITMEMAAKLGAIFNVPARWWIQMQADYDAEEIKAHPEWGLGISPLKVNGAFLLTPKGVLWMGESTSSKPSKTSIRREDLNNLPTTWEASEETNKAVRVVHYDNGSLALTLEET